MKFTIAIILSFLVFSHVFGQIHPADLFKKIRSAKSDSELLSGYRSLIEFYQIANDDSAMYYAEKGLKEFSNNQYKNGEAWMLDILGEMDDEHGRNELASRRLKFAQTLFHEINNAKGENEVAMNIGIMEAKKGNYYAANNYFINALKYYDSIDGKGGKLRVFTNLGIINERNNNKKLSLYYFNKAEELSKELPLCDETINLYNNIGGYYLDAGDTELAKKYIEEGINKSDKPEFIGAHLSCIINMGILYAHTGQREKGVSYLQQALHIAKEKNFPEEEANVLANLITVTQESDYKLSLNYAMQALEICKRIDDKPLQIELYDIIATMYKKQADFKNAYFAREARQQILDSIYNTNRALEIQNIGAMYELERSNNTVIHMQNENNAIFKRMYIVIAVGVLIIIAFIFVMNLYRKTIQLNKKLTQKEAELRESNGMKDKLFSIIGHDLRAPIARIPTIMEIIDFEDTTEEEKKYLMQNLMEHSLASLETLDKLLLWGQSLIKGVMIRQQTFNPKTYVDENIALKQRHANEKKITLINKVSEDIIVFADPLHFDFIIRNLLVNALKFSFEGGTITINADTNSKPGFMVFSVQDTGVGIEKAKFTEIFEPHYTHHGTANETGNGLGLMLCKEFVLKNGGQIWLESEPGKGTTFYFTLRKG